jgi:cation:H+ antiporter
MPILEFIVAAGCIFFIGNKLAQYAELFADRSGLGHGFVGVVLLGAVTSLPEMITTVGAITIGGSPDMALGNILGSNIFNILVLAFIDMLFIRELMKSSSKRTAAVSLLLLGLVALGVSGESQAVLWWLSPITVAIGIVYWVGMWSIYRASKRDHANSLANADAADATIGFPKLIALIGVSAFGLIAVALWSVSAVDRIVETYGIGATFAGGLFLAVATSLPELIVSYSAMKRGSTEMSAGNIFGSNIFNCSIVFIADLTNGTEVFFGSLADRKAHYLAIAVVAGFTFLSLLGDKYRSKVGLRRGAPDAWIILLSYLGFVWFLYQWG